MKILKLIEDRIKKYYSSKVPADGVCRKDPAERYNLDGYSIQMRTGKVYDYEIAKLVREHTHWWDRLDAHFICDCALEAQDIVWGYIEPPKGKWYFGRGYYGHWIEEDEWAKNHEYPHKDYMVKDDVADGIEGVSVKHFNDDARGY